MSEYVDHYAPHVGFPLYFPYFPFRAVLKINPNSPDDETKEGKFPLSRLFFLSSFFIFTAVTFQSSITFSSKLLGRSSKYQIMKVSLATGLRSIFILLGCLITASVVYTIVTDGLPFRIELLTPWMAATLIDFYINIFAIGAWIMYKESSWICSIFWIVLLVCLGSITTCFYIVLQFQKLSPKEFEKDPIYFVLRCHKKKSGQEGMNIFSVPIARVLFGALGCLMLGTLIYTIVRAGSPFHEDILFPWLTATLIDFYINVVALLVWLAYKEPRWIHSAIWIILFVCFGSISTCAYIVLQLFHLSSCDPVHLVLFNSDSRSENIYERTTEKESSILG